MLLHKEFVRMQQIKTGTEALLTLIQTERQLIQKQKEEIHKFLADSWSEVEEEVNEYPPCEEETDSEAEREADAKH